MDGENRKSNSLAISALAILIMATLFSGGIAVTQTFAQKEGAVVGKESAVAPTTAPETAQDATTATDLPGAVAPENGGVSGEQPQAEEPTQKDVNCGDIAERNFNVTAEQDVNNFDGDNDGVGCETQAKGGAGLLTETEVIITGDFIQTLEEENPAVADAVEVVSQDIAETTVDATTQANAENQNGGAETEVEVVIDGFVDEVAQNDSAVAGALEGAGVNETAVVANVAELAVVDQALENEGVDVTQEANVSQALDNVEITEQDIQTAAQQVQAEGAVEQELTPAAADNATAATTTETPAAEPANDTSVAVDVAVQETAEDAAPVVAQQTGQDEATVSALLQQAAEAIAAAQTRLGV